MKASQPFRMLTKVSWRENIGKGFLGSLVGLITGLLGGPIVGGICGLIYTVATVNFSPTGTVVILSYDDSIYLLPFLVAFILFQFGPIIGGVLAS